MQNCEIATDNVCYYGTLPIRCTVMRSNPPFTLPNTYSQRVQNGKTFAIAMSRLLARNYRVSFVVKNSRWL